MTITERIKSRAFRVLRNLPNYQKMTGENIKVPSYLLNSPIQVDEVCIGVYENLPGQIDESILLTNYGIHLYTQQQGWQFISFHNIRQVFIPSSQKDATTIILLLTNEETIEIPVRGKGRTGKSRDVLNFWRFLDRIIHKDIICR